MFALMVILLVVLGYTVLYRLCQIVEGEHTHEIIPSEQALGILEHGILFGFVLYALLHWI